MIEVSDIERARRLIRCMRVIEMNPGEKFFLFVLVEPFQGFVDDYIGRSLDSRQGDFFEFTQIEPVKIILKTLVEPPFGIEDISADESGRDITLRPEDFGDSLEFSRDHKPAVIPDAVEKRERASEKGSVGRKRQRGCRDAVIEFDTLSGERIDGRSFDAREAVATEPVSTEGIHANQDKIEVPFPTQTGKIPLSRDNKNDNEQGHQKESGDQGEQGDNSMLFSVFSRR